MKYVEETFSPFSPASFSILEERIREFGRKCNPKNGQCFQDAVLKMGSPRENGGGERGQRLWELGMYRNQKVHHVQEILIGCNYFLDKFSINIIYFVEFCICLAIIKCKQLSKN